MGFGRILSAKMMQMTTSRTTDDDDEHQNNDGVKSTAAKIPKCDKIRLSSLAISQLCLAPGCNCGEQSQYQHRQQWW